MHLDPANRRTEIFKVRHTEPTSEAIRYHATELGLQPATLLHLLEVWALNNGGLDALKQISSNQDAA